MFGLVQVLHKSTSTSLIITHRRHANSHIQHHGPYQKAPHVDQVNEVDKSSQACLDTFTMSAAMSFQPAHGTFNQRCATSISWDDWKEVRYFIHHICGLGLRSPDPNLQYRGWKYFARLHLLSKQRLALWKSARSQNRPGSNFQPGYLSIQGRGHRCLVSRSVWLSDV